MTVSMIRVLYGLEALPRGMALDNPRLPSVTLGPAPLRLNTHPVPPPVLADAASGHDARVAALTRWLLSLAGDWAAGRRRLISDYMAFVAAEIAANRDAIAARLARHDGLYAPEDRLWSALRPLPRAWIVADAAPVFADFAFWDGTTLFAAGLRAPAEGVVPLGSGEWPGAAFWRDETLPRSPFRRAPVR